MRRMPWATCLWPGLPQVWIRGSWSALAVACGAAMLLNLAVLGSFGWSELMGPGLRTALWVVLGALWGGAAMVSGVWGRRLATRANRRAIESPSNQLDPGSEEGTTVRMP